ncbi:hypothetical protein BGZ61DRAFT_453782 [Ilyonectria robusta]|uniref:uncharacterized protein n=1 Tax=Ilyonectria robusta TaxID=1079257 RepID=UPI001E8D0D8D|nr:uncharacterized protein BGZ61DRAFT_453782 [Ilyonectria robusta]KAH8686871.1 hypothetical protein BGZ61DRAFT_453782 [Ilyonectria robusta]
MDHAVPLLFLNIAFSFPVCEANQLPRRKWKRIALHPHGGGPRPHGRRLLGGVGNTHGFNMCSALCQKILAGARPS